MAKLFARKENFSIDHKHQNLNYRGNDYECDKQKIVGLSNAVGKPGAMVVKPLYTNVAGRTMMCLWTLDDPANIAISASI